MGELLSLMGCKRARSDLKAPDVRKMIENVVALFDSTLALPAVPVTYDHWRVVTTARAAGARRRGLGESRRGGESLPAPRAAPAVADFSVSFLQFLTNF